MGFNSGFKGLILVTKLCNFQQKCDLTSPFSVFIIVKRRSNLLFYCTEMRCISIQKRRPTWL